MARVTLAHPLILASASPRRRELLANVGIEVEVEGVDADESAFANEPPEDYVARVARIKLTLFLSRTSRTHGFVLAADTTVSVDGDILGKPATDGEARVMLRRLSGRTHRVSTAVALGRIGTDLLVERLVTTEVRFRSVSDATLDAYVATGEGRDKAGSYAIQGIGAGLVESIVGSYASVVGLPVAETVALLLEQGVMERWP